MISVSPASTVATTIAQASSATQGSKSAETPFSNLFHSFVDQSKDLDQKAANAVTGVLNGQGVDIHQAMIATQKAGLAFELSLEVRNKAVAAYQQMMGMQF